ncbi:MAG TPA: 1-phosphofructokinase [Pseudonocardiaceae bacterium]|jgi:1-phosphofructokinase|nr:1-phosphofructokinase [Pseudonocardiaceae bacterium]
MIVTVTANPSLDRTIEVEALGRGEVQQCVRALVHPGGKGVNVSRVLAAHGVLTTAVLCAGGSSGALLLELLQEANVPAMPVRTAGAVRTNLAITERDGTVTKLNELGPRCSADDADRLLRRAVAAIAGNAANADSANKADTTDWVAGCGSLPPGMATDSYARLIELAHARGARVAIDTSGEPLAACLAAAPDLVKPNRAELAECTGVDIQTVGDALKAAEQLRDRGARAVLASLGADGAVLVDSRGTLFGEAPVSRPRSSVGAGDSLLAGFLSAGGHGRAALAEALAWGSAAVSLPGSRLPGPSDLHRAAVTVHGEPPLDRPLSERS